MECEHLVCDLLRSAIPNEQMPIAIALKFAIEKSILKAYWLFSMGKL